MTPLYGFLQYMLFASDGLTTGLMMEIMLGKEKETIWKRIGRPCAEWLLLILVCLPSYLMHQRVLSAINTLFYAIGTILIVRFLYRRRWRNGILLFIGIYLCEIGGEVAYLLSFPPNEVKPIDWTSEPCMIYVGRALLMAFGIKMIFALLYRWKESGKIRKDPIQVVFIIFLVCFFMMLPALYFAMSGSGQYSFSNQDTFTLFFSMVSVLIVSGITFVFQNRKAQQRVENLEMLKTVQDDYYVSLEKNSLSMSKLRHDYLNILQPIGRYIKEERNEEAFSLIEDLTGKIRETGNQNRCNIPVVNAILNEKEQVCKEKQIQFSISLRFMEECYIPDLELCRVFGNMLDNAIRACDRIEDPSKRWIELKGSMAQEHLLISCQNSRMKNEKKQIFGTGLGQNILKELAKQFHGHFHVDDSTPERYSCSIDLLNPKPVAKVSMECDCV